MRPYKALLASVAVAVAVAAAFAVAVAVAALRGLIGFHITLQAKGHRLQAKESQTPSERVTPRHRQPQHCQYL